MIYEKKGLLPYSQCVPIRFEPFFNNLGNQDKESTVVFPGMGKIQSLVIFQSFFYGKNRRGKPCFHQFKIHQ